MLMMRLISSTGSHTLEQRRSAAATATNLAIGGDAPNAYAVLIEPSRHTNIDWRNPMAKPCNALQPVKFKLM